METEDGGPAARLPTRFKGRIAATETTVRAADGTELPLQVVLYRPFASGRPFEVLCSFRVAVAPDVERSGSGVGAEPVAAIYSALVSLASQLTHLQEELRFSWIGQELWWVEAALGRTRGSAPE